MKKLILSLIAGVALVSCNEEPKLNQQEETAVEAQLQSDQKSMDSLEAAIKAQMDELNTDSSEMDSL